MIRQYELVERVKAYDSSADEDALNRAYVFSMQAHGTQTRESGDPYFSHPIEVAGLLAGMKLDTASIITGLLHDVVEDTGTTLPQIEKLFGPNISRLVDGVTKLSRLELQSDATKHAENFRKLVLAMSEDIRVLLVKLADRLHNMRTLHFVKSADKRRRIALETMEIYAPLAERIGMQQMKDELEDIAFGVLNNDARDSIITRLDFLRESGGDLVGRVIEELRQTMAKADVDATISGREKSPYSIWRKMERKSVSFEQLADIMAFRIEVESIGECYQALGAIHSRYPVVPSRFKDYISTPKPNGYRSLHTGVFGPERQRIEIQIRTHKMMEQADFGVAAHWSYKQDVQAVEGTQYRWLRDLLDVLESAAGPEEFLEHTKLAMFTDQVFCFTPKGDLINLPNGATPVDFAYAVHSEVGDTCVGAKVNGRMMPLRSELRNGDQVEIVTSRAQTPSPTWERFVVTAKARARIRRFVRAQERDEYITLGRQMVQKGFREEGYEFTEKGVEGVVKVFKMHSSDDIYASVGKGEHSVREVVNAVFPGARDLPANDKVVPLPKPKNRSGKVSAIPLKGLIDGMAVHYAGCCHPLPGDRIVGIVSTGRGVTIHTIDCDTLTRFADEPQRWLDVSWDSAVAQEKTAEERTFIGRISVIIMNEPGSLGNTCSVIGKSGGNITNLKITNRNMEFFEVLVDVDVRDVKHLTNIIAALRATPAINAVERAGG